MKNPCEDCRRKNCCEEDCEICKIYKYRCIDGEDIIKLLKEIDENKEVK